MFLVGPKKQPEPVTIILDSSDEKEEEVEEVEVKQTSICYNTPVRDISDIA